MCRQTQFLAAFAYVNKGKPTIRRKVMKDVSVKVPESEIAKGETEFPDSQLLSVVKTRSRTKIPAHLNKPQLLQC